MNIIMSRPLQHHYPHRNPPPTTPPSPLDFTYHIPMNELKLSNETLGSGSFGTVFKARWRGRTVAVKQFRTREEIDSFKVEVQQLSQVRHKNIVTLYGASTTLQDTAYLVMEYAEGGSLNHLLHECKQQQYDLSHACNWALQTARGVAYLHEMKPKAIMHRDLKPANLLLFAKGKILKICDFGTACTVKTQMTNNTGSASYMAPEVFATSSYLESGDVFSWSIIFWEILARRQPYSQQYSNPYQILWRVKQEGARPNELENCPKIIHRLITKSWNKNPYDRPTMRQVADQMELIFSLTQEKHSTSCRTNIQEKQKSPICQLLPNFNQMIQAGLSFAQTTKTGGQNTTSSCENTSNLRDRFIYRNVLQHKLDVLRQRSSELEVRCDKSVSVGESLDEFEKLKKDCDLLKKQWKQSMSAINSPTSPDNPEHPILRES